VLLLLLLGSIDVSNAILVTRRLEAVATAVADMASTGSAQEQALNIITD
jgi:Flp pilus assembly protein TadG